MALGGCGVHYPRAPMDQFLHGCQGLGLALASGMVAGAISGAFGHQGLHRHVLGVLAIVAAALLFGASLTAVDHPAWPGWIAGAAAGLGAFGLTEDVVSSARQRVEGGRPPGSLVAIVVASGLVLAALSLVVSPVSLVALAAALWLAIGRRRRSQRKHEGLRVLR